MLDAQFCVCLVHGMATGAFTHVLFIKSHRSYWHPAARNIFKPESEKSTRAPSHTYKDLYNAAHSACKQILGGLHCLSSCLSVLQPWCLGHSSKWLPVLRRYGRRSLLIPITGNQLVKQSAVLWKMPLCDRPMGKVTTDTKAGSVGMSLTHGSSVVVSCLVASLLASAKSSHTLVQT